MSQLPLKSRGALVTGVSRRIGIGAAIAYRLAEMGATVFRCGWSAHDAAQPWGADLPGMDVLEADFLDRDAPAAIMTEAVRCLGHVDILVANHARSDHLGLMDTTAHELDAQWAVNAAPPCCSSRRSQPSTTAAAADEWS